MLSAAYESYIRFGIDFPFVSDDAVEFEGKAVGALFYHQRHL